MTTPDTRTSDQRVREALEPAPKGRSYLRGFTIRAKPPREPYVAPPIRRRVQRMRPVDGVVTVLARPSAAAPLASTPMTTAAVRAGIVVDAPGVPMKAERITHPRGAEAILRHLKSKGVTVTLSTDGQHVVPVTVGGRLMGPERELIEATGPLLAAHLRGEPLRCTVGAHEPDVDDLAVTLLVGGASCCAHHLDGGA